MNAKSNVVQFTPRPRGDMTGDDVAWLVARRYGAGPHVPIDPRVAASLDALNWRYRELMQAYGSRQDEQPRPE